MAARNVKNNNPHNLRVSSVEQAKGFGWPGVVGIDQNGFAIFDTAANGELAGDQQRRVNSKQLNDQGNPFTIRDSLTKHVRGGGDDNPDNAVGFFERAGIDPDSTLANLDPNAYNQILAFSEGGAKDTFFGGGGRGAAGLNNSITATRPDEGQFAAIPSAQLDQLKAQRDLTNTVGTNPLISANTRPDLDKVLMEGGNISRLWEDTPTLTATGINGNQVSGNPLISALGGNVVTSENFKEVADRVGPGLEESSRINDLRLSGAHQVDVRNAPSLPRQRGEPTPQDQPKFPSEMTPQQGSMIPQGKPVDILTKAQMGGEGGFDLSKLLGALGSNAGLSALGIGAQGIGSLLEGRAQNKANKAASKQQKVNNAIAAFTGGNAAQAASERGSSTGGGLLKALGQGLGGFAQVRASEEQAEAVLQQDRDHDETLLEIARIQQGGAGSKGADKLAAEQAKAESAFGIIEETMDTLLNVHRAGGISTGGLAINLPSWAGGDVQTFMESAGGMLLGKMNDIYTLGRLSDKDIQILRTSIPKWDEGVADVEAKLAAVRMLIAIRRKQYQSGTTNLNTADLETPPGIYESISGVKGAGGGGSLDNSSAGDFL